MTETEIQTVIDSLAQKIQSARTTVNMISSEFVMNGKDSLANIDYGALLNTQLQEAKSLFDSLDSQGLFTAGWIAED